METRRRTGSLIQAFWLVLCVFLLYQQPVSMALSFEASQRTSYGQTDFQTDNFDDQCLEWEEYDGLECVCASDYTARCSDKGGMVCDNKGRQYRSQCHFSLETCQQNVSFDTNVASCGACKILRLTGGKDFPLGVTLETFERIGADTGITTRYRSLANPDTEVYYVREIGSWAIGFTNITGEYIRMVQLLKSSYPAEGNPGLLTPQLNGTNITWEFDPTYRLECIEDTEEGLREKRFIFALIAGIVAAVTVTTTTLKVVQATKGCLYYPSVCSLRDEIKDHLLPQVSQKRQNFIDTFGQPRQLKTVVDKILNQLSTMKPIIETIPKLHLLVNFKLSSLLSSYSSIQEDFPEIKSILAYDNVWLSNLAQQASQKLNMLQMDLVMSMSGLVTTSLSAVALAASVIGGILAVGFATVDVVSSVMEEKNARDDLQRKKSELLEMRSKIELAFKKMNDFQQKFCEQVVNFIYELARKGKEYDNTFLSLFNFLSRTYGDSTNRCRYQHIVKQSNLSTLLNLANHYLPPFLRMLESNVEQLKQKIRVVDENNAFLAQIERKVIQNAEAPDEIFKFIKENKPRITTRLYRNLFSLLKFIAKSIIPQRSCYWGYSFDQFRRDNETERHFTTIPVCSSPEIRHLTNVIEHGVQNQTVVCSIFRQVLGTVFRNVFQTVRYIADYVMPTKSCYWGYDLEDVRGNPNVTEIKAAKIDSNLLQTLQNLETAAAPLPIIRRIMKGQFGISNERWQTFIICHKWHNWNLLHGITCPRKAGISSCFPTNQQFASC